MMRKKRKKERKKEKNRDEKIKIDHSSSSY
jgi:hypothetical protein